ncbi:MAG TPA: ISL3 family transposase [Verrucomicrobiota bacterium]|nr:ISL3 family transposase [Verrucomicrobiota bacterium]
MELSRVMTLADVSGLTGLSWDTVKDIVQAQLQHDYGQPRLKDLKFLAIDEIYVGKRKRFYTLVLDLESGQIVWVGHGRGLAALGQFWRRLRLSKARIQAVAMDMSGAYWAAVLEHLPGVAVVFDRFHIMKLMNEKLDELRRRLVREAAGAMRQTIKGTRYLLLTRAANLAKEKLPKLADALKLNQPLSQAYYLKEELSLLWEQPSRAAMEDFLRQWCARAMETGIALLRQMAKTLQLHARGILSWWEHRLSSGKMEGVNNKIKTLTRQAYGYRDEAFFILKLLALHHARIKLIG